jgi:hypothetical protein
MGLDGRLEPVYPADALGPFGGGVELTDVGDVGDPVVGAHPAAQIVVQV